jgi:hypothetical protein
LPLDVAAGVPTRISPSNALLSLLLQKVNHDNSDAARVAIFKTLAKRRVRAASLTQVLSRISLTAGLHFATLAALLPMTYSPNPLPNSAFGHFTWENLIPKNSRACWSSTARR